MDSNWVLIRNCDPTIDWSTNDGHYVMFNVCFLFFINFLFYYCGKCLGSGGLYWQWQFCCTNKFLAAFQKIDFLALHGQDKFQIGLNIQKKNEKNLRIWVENASHCIRQSSRNCIKWRQYSLYLWLFKENQFSCAIPKKGTNPCNYSWISRHKWQRQLFGRVHYGSNL